MAKKRRNCMNPNAALTITPGFRPEAKIRETLPTGLDALDALIEGFPRGAISEILGQESSGRTTLVHSLLAASTAKFEICAYIDTDDSFDPVSASAAGVALSQLVWIRCGHNAGHALKAADYLLHAGGFGAIVLDLCQVPPRVANRIPISYWYRFRLAIENTPTILALVEKEPLAKSCAALMLEMQRKKTLWTGAPGFELLREVELEAVPRKPVRPHTAQFKARAIG
jgi:recombination protein RecA